MSSVKELQKRFAGPGAAPVPVQLGERKPLTSINSNPSISKAPTPHRPFTGISFSGTSGILNSTTASSNDSEQKPKEHKLFRAESTLRALRSKYKGCIMLDMLDLANNMDNDRSKHDREGVKRVVDLREKYRGGPDASIVEEADKIEKDYKEADRLAFEQIMLVKKNYNSPEFIADMDEGFELEKSFKDSDKEICKEIQDTIGLYRIGGDYSLMFKVTELALKRKQDQLRFFEAIQTVKDKAKLHLGCMGDVLSGSSVTKERSEKAMEDLKIENENFQRSLRDKFPEIEMPKLIDIPNDFLV